LADVALIAHVPQSACSSNVHGWSCCTFEMCGKQPLATTNV